MQNQKFTAQERAYWARTSTPPHYYEDDGELLQGDEVVNTLREFTDAGGKFTREQLEEMLDLLGIHA